MTAEVLSEKDDTAYTDRTVFLVLFVINFCISCGFAMSDSFFSVYYQELGAGNMLIGFSAVSYQISKIFIGPVTGKAEAIYGNIRLMLFSLTLYLFVAASFMVSKNIYYLVLLRFIQGAACAAFKPSIYSILDSAMPKGKRGEFFGSFDVSFYIAIAIGPAAGGFIIHRFGYDGLFSVLLFQCTLVASAGFSFLKTDTERKTQDKIIVATHRPTRTETGLYFFIIGKSVIIACFTLYFPLYLLNSSDVNITEAGMILSLSIIVMAVFLKPMGRLSDKCSRLLMIASGGVLTSIIYILIPETFSKSSAIIFAVICGFAGAVSQPAGVTMLMKCSENGTAPSTILGRFNSVMSIGFILGTMISSLFADLVSIRGAFVYAGCLNMVFVFISIMILAERNSASDLNMIEDAR